MGRLAGMVNVRRDVQWRLADTSEIAGNKGDVVRNTGERPQDRVQVLQHPAVRCHQLRIRALE